MRAHCLPLTVFISLKKYRRKKKKKKKKREKKKKKRRKGKEGKLWHYVGGVVYQEK